MATKTTVIVHLRLTFFYVLGGFSHERIEARTKISGSFMEFTDLLGSNLDCMGNR